jgi:hypothetical protein
VPAPALHLQVAEDHVLALTQHTAFITYISQKVEICWKPAI